MTLSSYRRTKTRQAEPTQQLIVFQILQEWFALPIRAAYKVVPIGQVYGSHQGSIGLTRYQDQDVLVIDIQRRIFGEQMSSPLLSASEAPATTQPASPAQHQQYLLLIQSSQGELIGLPLRTFPSLRRVPESAFKPLPPMYLAEGKIRCVSALVTAKNDRPPTFLLNLSQLLESPVALPAVSANSHPQNSAQSKK